MSKIEIRESGIYIDNEYFDMLSGDIHYFRIYPGGLKRRLKLMKAFGLNTIQTYCPWNLHEPQKGKFNFEGLCDLKGFLQLADDMGFKVLLRPEPYICSEWDMGGLPSWLLKENVVLRSSDPQYLKHVRSYIDRVCREFLPFLASNGGPVIAVAVENEYGSYGNDKKYLEELKNMFLENGVDVPLYTTDGYDLNFLQNGTVSDCWIGVNYRSESEIAINALRKFQPDKKPFVGEYWSGRAIHWCENYKRRDIAEVVDGFKEGLENGAYMNFYMFAGGTNFGFMNGANYGLTFAAPEGTPYRYIPIITSYDCDALISEEGRPTPKYFACRKALYEYLGKEEPPMPEIDWKSQTVSPIKLNFISSLWENVDYTDAYKSLLPLAMEDMGQDYGYCLYKTEVIGNGIKQQLVIPNIRDRADIYLDRKFVGTVMRERQPDRVVLDLEAGKKYTIEILVENMGRINFGSKICEKKGITTQITLDMMTLFNWECLPLELKTLSSVKYNKQDNSKGPIFAKGTFKAKSGVDTFLDMRDFKKGIVFVNGFNLGRYWSEGPQFTLYVPGELLAEENTVEIFEQYSLSADGCLKTLSEPLFSDD